MATAAPRQELLVERTYKQPGSYSEILKVTDARGRIDYDFAMVQVIDKDRKEKFPPTIHASYAPTFGIRAGDPVMFKVRTFRADTGNELWDFGDGSEPVRVRSDGNSKPHDAKGYAETVHRFAKPGHYVVRVEGTGHAGAKAIAHLQVRVGEKGRRKHFEITIAAGQHERKNTPVRVQVPLGQIGNEKLASVTLTGPDSKAIPAQLTKPSLILGGGSELHFILPHLLPGESVRLKATVSTDSPSSAEGFAWHDHPGDHTDLCFGKRPVLSYFYHPLDETSKASRDRTYKVFHHLYSPQGDTVVTNGLPDDPKIHSPHHRGIFYGFNRISYGNGKTANLWHCTNGSYQEHDRFLSSEEGPVLGRHRVAISWHGEDKKTFAEEERELTVYNVPGGQFVEFASRLRSPAGPVKFDGDPQHAGFQFRAHNDVDAKTSKETIYIRTDGVGKPDETRNWDPETRQGPVNLPWNAMSFVLKGKRYTAAYLDHPKNPKEARFSERAFGRFGSYFEYTVDEGKPLTVNYRLWLQEGQMKPEEVAVLSKDFVEPVKVTAQTWTNADPVEKQRAGADSADKDYAALLPRIPPKSPAEALKAFQVHPGFRIELVGRRAAPGQPGGARLRRGRPPVRRRISRIQPERQQAAPRPRPDPAVGRHRWRRRLRQEHRPSSTTSTRPWRSAATTAASSSARCRTSSTARTPTATARRMSAGSSSPASLATSVARP